MERILDKLKKIAALAESGVAGEKESAQRLLDSLLTKHGIRLEEVASETMTYCPFPYRGALEKKLLIQIFGLILNESNVGYKGGKGRLWKKVTCAAQIDILDCFAHYRQQLRKIIKQSEKEIVSAFIHANHIFPKTAQNDNEKQMSEEEIERALRIMALMQGIKSDPWKKTFKLTESAA